MPKLKDAVKIEASLKENTKLISNHIETSAHQRIVEDLKIEKRSNIEKDIENILEEKYSANNLFSVTDTIITTAYFCARIRSSSKCFVSFVYLLKLKGVEIGDHCRNPSVGQNMISTISKQMQLDLIYHLLADDKPFSIICDSTSDISQKNQFEVLFMSYENNLPMTYHYRLITTKTSSTGEAYANILLQNLEDDGLLDYTKKNLVG